jgi:phospholipid N-methyltransferase
VQVRAKKSLGQHFLKDLDAAKRIVDGLQPNGAYNKVLEIGPGMGVLTQFLVKKTEYPKDITSLLYPDFKKTVNDCFFGGNVCRPFVRTFGARQHFA